MKKSEISKRTKEAFAAALKSAMASKPFDKITVRELTEATDVTRNTFYHHFEDIYALLKWMYDNELVKLLEQSKNCATWDDGILLFLRYIEQNRQVCLCAYNSVGRDELQRMFQQSVQTATQAFVHTLIEEEGVDAKPEHVEFIIEFNTMALMGTSIQWLRNPRGRTPEDMIDLIRIAAYGNVRAALRRSAESPTRL